MKTQYTLNNIMIFIYASVRYYKLVAPICNVLSIETLPGLCTCTVIDI